MNTTVPNKSSTSSMPPRLACPTLGLYAPLEIPTSKLYQWNYQSCFHTHTHTHILHKAFSSLRSIEDQTGFQERVLSNPLTGKFLWASTEGCHGNWGNHFSLSISSPDIRYLNWCLSNTGHGVYRSTSCPPLTHLKQPLWRFSQRQAR